MNTEKQSTTTRDIPTPPAGGSWTFDEVKWAWVPNDPLPQTEVAIAAAPSDNITIEQEQ